MKIGIDCRAILHPHGGESAGIGHYVHHLVESLLAQDDAAPANEKNEFVLFFDSRDASEVHRELHAHRPNVRVRLLPFSAYKKYLPFLHRHVIVSAAFEREHLDVLHGPAGHVPLFYRRPWVVTVHDLAIYDHPEWFAVGPLGTQAFSLSLVTPHSIEHASRVIAVSETTAKEVVKRFAVPKEHLDVIYEGSTVKRDWLFSEGKVPVPFGEATKPLQLPHGLHPHTYALFLGTIEPRKNVAFAIRAFAAALRVGRLPKDAVFVIAGKIGWKEGEAFAALRHAEREFPGRIRYIGYLATEDKHAVLANARVFLFPTRYEGFGLPLLESMHAGVPIVATDAEAVREVCQDAALITPQNDVLAFAGAIIAAWPDSPDRARMVARARTRAAAFSWPQAAQQTLRAYRKAAEPKIELHSHGA